MSGRIRYVLEQINETSPSESKPLTTDAAQSNESETVASVESSNENNDTQKQAQPEVILRSNSPRRLAALRNTRNVRVFDHAALIPSATPTIAFDANKPNITPPANTTTTNSVTSANTLRRTSVATTTTGTSVLVKRTSIASAPLSAQSFDVNLIKSSGFQDSAPSQILKSIPDETEKGINKTALNDDERWPHKKRLILIFIIFTFICIIALIVLMLKFQKILFKYVPESLPFTINVEQVYMPSLWNVSPIQQVKITYSGSNMTATILSSLNVSVIGFPTALYSYKLNYISAKVYWKMFNSSTLLQIGSNVTEFTDSKDIYKTTNTTLLIPLLSQISGRLNDKRYVYYDFIVNRCGSSNQKNRNIEIVYAITSGFTANFDGSFFEGYTRKTLQTFPCPMSHSDVDFFVQSIYRSNSIDEAPIHELLKSTPAS